MINSCSEDVEDCRKSGGWKLFCCFFGTMTRSERVEISAGQCERVNGGAYEIVYYYREWYRYVFPLHLVDESN